MLMPPDVTARTITATAQVIATELAALLPESDAAARVHRLLHRIEASAEDLAASLAPCPVPSPAPQRASHRSAIVVDLGEYRTIRRGV